MRKIESQMCKAIQANTDWHSANTEVVSQSDGVSNVYLHGNKIAEIGDDYLTVFDGGYKSQTTKSRLNALINEFCNGLTDGVYQRAHVWYLSDNNVEHVFTNGYTFA